MQFTPVRTAVDNLRVGHQIFPSERRIMALREMSFDPSLLQVHCESASEGGCRVSDVGTNMLARAVAMSAVELVHYVCLF